MKAILQPTVSHEALEFLTLVSYAEGVPLSSAKAIEIARQRVQRAATDVREHTLYGNWTQAMFLELVAALGRVRMIRPEDGVKCYAADAADVLVPDYRVVYDARRRDCLIEVKNCHKKHTQPFSIRSEDMRALQKYARIARADLKIAVYFSRYGYWALLSPRSFTKVGKRHKITFVDAMMRNEMELLGDVMLGTEPPLSIRLRMQKLRSRKTKDGETFVGKIVDAGMYCGERKIRDESEQHIASLLILYGSWTETEYAKLNEPGFVTTIYEYKPSEDEGVEGRKLRLCDYLSRMFSRWYTRVTCGDERGVPPKQIHATSEPMEFRRLIPNGYTGKDLPLWLFQMKPKLD